MRPLNTSKAPSLPRRAARHLFHESYLAPMAAMMLAAAILVPPAGEFPLNDDWLHVMHLERLLAEPPYQPHPYLGSTLITQLLWAAPFVKLFGFSHVVLRVSTMVLGAVGAWAAARCAREAGLPRWQALLCGALILAHPIYFNLCYTFMTDVPFFAAVMLAAWLYIRALKHESGLYAFGATLFAVAATFIRPHGVFVSAAFALTLAGQWMWLKRRPALGMTAGFLGGGAIGAALGVWWLAAQGLGSAQEGWVETIGENLSSRILQFFRYPFVVMAYFGFAAGPIAFGRLWQLSARCEKWPRAQWIWAAAFCAVASAIIVLAPPLIGGPGMTRMPLLRENILHDLGTGPRTLSDAYSSGNMWAPTSLGGKLWWPITAGCVAAAGMLFAQAVMAGRNGRRVQRANEVDRPSFAFWGFLLCLSAVYVLSYMPFLPRTFDRYLLVATVPALIFVMKGIQPRPGRGVFCAIAAPTLLLFAFSLACNQDYLAWNAARWRCIEFLLKDEGADPLEIDGGYEYNGLYTMETYFTRNKPPSYNYYGPKGWWLLEPRYAVQFREHDGWRVIHREPYFSWLGLTHREILALEAQTQ